MSYVEPDKQDAHFYRNAQATSWCTSPRAGGRLESVFGDLPFREGDYLVIHRGILHRYRFDPSGEPPKLLVIESRGHVRWPKRYRNEFGQLMEGAPYSERDIRRPLELDDARRDGRLSSSSSSSTTGLNEMILDHHPFDVVGWDGYFYPWAFNIRDFEPIVGRVHQPPPVHQTFQGDGFVVCSFCPRPFDFDPNAVPAPYNHSNVDSDEVLYYASSEFMSRKGIEFGSITHPPGRHSARTAPGPRGSVDRREVDERAGGDDGQLPAAARSRRRRWRSRTRTTTGAGSRRSTQAWPSTRRPAEGRELPWPDRDRRGAGTLGVSTSNSIRN